MTQSRGLGGRGLRGGRGHGIAFRSYSRSDRQTSEGFKRNVTSSKLPLKRTLSQPLHGEWAAEKLGWGQVDRLELLLLSGEMNVASVSGAEMDRTSPRKGMRRVQRGPRLAPSCGAWTLCSWQRHLKARDEDSGWKTTRSV